MALRTARFEGVADVRIDEERCNGCGLCVRVCKGAPLYLDGKTVRVDQSRGFGCMACGHCVAVCPHEAVTVEGRDLHPSDVLPLPPPGSVATPQALHALMATRRSIREWAPRDVPREVLERVLDAAATAPMGLPPTDVQVLAFHGRDAVRALRTELAAELARWKWMGTAWGSLVLAPWMGKEGRRAMREFVVPAVRMFEQKQAQGEDWFLYDAPALLLFQGSALGDPADAVIAATHAMLAAHAEGLGTILLGFPGLAVHYSKRLKAKYGIPPEAPAGLALALGYPGVRYHRVLKRRLGGVRWFGAAGEA